MTAPAWSDYKAYRGLAGTDYDTVGATVVAMALDMVAKRTGRKSLSAATYTETVDGTGSTSFDLRNYPINSITSIKFVTPGGTETTYSDTTYAFDAEAGRVHRTAGDDRYWPEDTIGYPRNRFGKNPAWPYGAQCLEVVYNGGHDADGWTSFRKLAIYQVVEMIMGNRGVDELSRASQGGALAVQMEQAVQRDEKMRFALSAFSRGTA